MGASLSRTAEITLEEVDDSINLALAVMMSQGAGASPEGTNLGVLRPCKQCNSIAYLRQGICLNPACVLGYLCQPAQAMGEKLQS